MSKISIEEATNKVLEAIEELDRVVNEHNEKMEDIAGRYLQSLRGPIGYGGPAGPSGPITPDNLVEAVLNLRPEQKEVIFRILKGD